MFLHLGNVGTHDSNRHDPAEPADRMVVRE
jgi:hypothetical protein